MNSKKARWVRKSHLFKADEYYCSACGTFSERPGRYCAACGARMKGVKADAGWVDEMEALDAFLDD